ncbi:MAG: excinuclease ABC subunit UvrC, partial [Chlamydiota bacterium]
MPFDTQKLLTFPIEPGVYIMKDKAGRVLYIGKANNLKQRVKQYFSGQDTRPQIPLLLAKVETVETIQVFSEKEALLLENTLIKKHKPHYNILLKDDKSYIVLKMTREEWPRLLLLRSKEAPPQDSHSFGPYRGVPIAKELLQMMQKTFPLRQCSNEEFARRKRPCLLYQMKRCIAPCVDLCTKNEYDIHTKRALQFLRGGDKEILKSLHAEMEEKSEKLDFEEAALIRERIKQIEKGLEKQSVSSFSIKDCDALAIYRGGSLTTLARAVFRSGRLMDMDIRHFKDSLEEDEELLSSFIIQEYLGHKRPLLLLLPFSLPKSVQELFDDMTLVRPQLGAKKTLVDMAAKNALSAFERESEERLAKESALLDLKAKLGLQNLPYRIECFDNSHLSGSGTVSAMVQYIDGKKATKGYRRFIIREAKASDDYGAFEEALTRRYSKGDLPDMLLIDGGKGQLSIAKKVFEKLGIITVDLIALAKEEGRHDRGLSAEQIFSLSGTYSLPTRSST